MRINRKLVYKFSAVSIMPALVAVIGVATAAVDSPDAITNIASVQFSTRPSAPNLIEVFTDGFDHQLNQEAIDAESTGVFKDFHDLTYTYGTHSSTNLSKALGLGGYRAYNPAAIYERSNKSADWTNTYFNNEMNRALAKHLAVASDQFSQRAIIGLVDSFAEGSSNYVWDGDANYARSFFDRNIDLMNWAGARNIVAGAVGVTNTSLQALYTKALLKISKVNNTNARGARVFLQNAISHDPRKTGLDGNYRFNVKPQEASLAQLANLKLLIESLKKQVDENGVSVYDNSMLVFWGDHADHSQPTDTLSNLINRKQRTRLMIKWPNVSKPALTPISDAVVSLGQINYLIHDYFVNRPDSPWTVFSQNAFSVNRELPFYVGNEQGIVLAKLQNGLMVPTTPVMPMGTKGTEAATLTLSAVAGVDV